MNHHTQPNLFNETYKTKSNKPIYKELKVQSQLELNLAQLSPSFSCMLISDPFHGTIHFLTLLLEKSLFHYTNKRNTLAFFLFMWYISFPKFGNCNSIIEMMVTRRYNLSNRYPTLTTQHKVFQQYLNLIKILSAIFSDLKC